MEKLLLNEREAIAYLGGPQRTKFLEEVAAGRIPSLKLGRLRRYPTQGLLAYVELLRSEQGVAGDA